ncbi:MAG: hypothetical protein KF777_25290, partial [Planctomycetaceae bacterium]|nr:hypothetical protein [Planctomycetaceae bacterium]
MMVALNFNWWGYTFQDGLNVLSQSFTSARDALRRDIELAQEEAMGYQDSVAQGLVEPDIERDEDGYVILDHADVLQMHVERAEECAMGLRKAIVIAAYHHWERSARGWTQSEHGKHLKLVELSLAQDYPIDAKLGAVRDLVNLLKHASEKWGNDLVASWPEVFPPNFQKSSKTDWYESVWLTDKHVFEVLTILGGSGPKTNNASPAP